jgi:hypothetical protein
MTKHYVFTLVAILLAAAAGLSNSLPALAQATAPSLPGAPQATPSYPGGSRAPLAVQGGSGNYSVSAAANEHAAFLWVVDNIQHSVVLCEKTDTHDFACTKKPLP